MRAFLGVCMVLIVSGDDVTITGVFKENVLLPCTCSERNVKMEFKWQRETPRMQLVLKYNNATSNFYGRYMDRASIFLPENNNNCSLLLTNITADDLGKYRCIFYSQNQYRKFYVHLNITARYNVCQKDSANNLNGVKDFQCDVKGHYQDTEIQWSLDGQLLANSPTTNISNTHTLDAATGLYHFTSKLITKLNGTSNPRCHVKAKGISTIIHDDCKADPAGFEKPFREEDSRRYRYFKLIPITLVIVLSLLLMRHWKSSQNLQEERGSGD